jgi:hypothetical protein
MVPSINYSVGLVMIHIYKDVQEIERQMECIILSWDECFRAEVSRRKWGISFEPVTNGYRLDQPFYHVIPYDQNSSLLHHSEREKNLYVPQRKLMN